MPWPNDLTASQKRLFDYWRALPRDAHPLVPAKRHLRPQDLVDIAKNLGMAEYIDAYQLRVRFLGTEIDDLTGRRLSNTNAFDIYSPDTREFFALAWQLFFGRPCGWLVQSVMHVTRGRYETQFDLHLPMCDDFGEVRFVVSIFERVHTRPAAPNAAGPLYRGEDEFRAIFLDIGAGVEPMPPYPR